jgi:hypothetical protein
MLILSFSLVAFQAEETTKEKRLLPNLKIQAKKNPLQKQADMVKKNQLRKAVIKRLKDYNLTIFD